MKSAAPCIAIVGATGAVGKEMIEVLESRNFPFSEVRLFASERSRGKSLKIAGKTATCDVLAPQCFDGIDIAFFDASDEVSKKWVPEALKAGAWVIDNSGTHRMDPETPLLVPEINGHLAETATNRKLLAGPNCTTVQLVMALKPLHELFGLERVNVATYQSVSGAGTLAMDELTEQAQAHLEGRPAVVKVLKHPIAFNCIPQIGSFDAEGFTSEEKKVIHETRKILDLPNLRVTCTAVRVPAYLCHAESVSVEFSRPVDLALAREALSRFPGVEVVDEPAHGKYPMNRTSAKQDLVSVGRIRKDPSCENGLQFWVVSDNLRKGAALNAIQMAEKVLPLLR